MSIIEFLFISINLCNGNGVNVVTTNVGGCSDLITNGKERFLIVSLKIILIIKF